MENKKTMPPKIKKELLFLLSKKKLKKKNLTLANVNKISNKFIKELKKSCKKKYGKRSCKKNKKKLKRKNKLYKMKPTQK